MVNGFKNTEYIITYIYYLIDKTNRKDQILEQTVRNVDDEGLQ